MALSFMESDSDSDSDDSLGIGSLPIQKSPTSTLSSASSSAGIASSSAKDVSPTPPAVPAAVATPTPKKLTSEKKRKIKEQNDARVKGAKLTDVVVSPGATNQIGVSKNADKTRLESINGVLVKDCSTDSIRFFHSKYKAVGNKKEDKQKLNLCAGIVQCYVAYEEGTLQLDENGELIGKGGKRHSINKKRYINVLYSDIIRPRLEEKGRQLTKDELTEGIKQDENLHRAICGEYNKSELYAEDLHPDVGMKGSAALDNKPIVWQQSKDFLNVLTKAYEEAHRNWKKSGNHGNFPDFVHGNKNLYLVYLHEFDSSYPGFLDKMTGKLPDDVFRESLDDLVSESSAKKRKRVRKNMDEDLLNSFASLQDTFASKAAEAAKANQILADASNVNKRLKLVETKEFLDKQIGDGKKEFKGLFDSAKTKSRLPNNKLVDDYKNHKEKAKGDGTFESFLMGMIDDDSEDGELHGIFDEMHQIERKIEDWKRVLAQTNKELNATLGGE